MLKRFFSFVSALFFLVLAASSSAFSQTAQNLVLNQSIEREIKGGETQIFTVEIAAGQAARVEIEQRGVDVSLAAVNPQGERFIETESPSGVQGNDLILVTARETGIYRIEVSPADPRAAAGKYTITLKEIRPILSRDGEINQAAARITKLANETVALRQSGTREGRRQAIENFRQISALSKIKEDKIWETVALLTIGLIYEQLGEIQNALSFYQQGLTLARAVGSRQYEGSALNNLAVNYLALGENETAILYLNQAIALQREAGNRRGEAINLNNFGTAYLLSGDLRKAEDFYRQGLVLRREIKDQRGEGFALNNLGQVFLQAGDLPQAIDFFGQALTLRRAIADRAGEATTLRNIGKAVRAAGDKTKAFEYFERANVLAKELGDRRIEADTFYHLAAAEKERGNLPKAIENLENGLQIIERIRGELVSSELRTSYFSTVQDFYELYTELLVARYEKSKNEDDLARTLEISERSRARSLVELLQDARVSIKRGVDEKLTERESDLQESLNAKYRQRAQLLSGKPSPEQTAKITAEINSLTLELENLKVQIRRDSPRYADLRETRALTAAEIQKLLDEETVLLEYKLGAERSFLWFVTANSTEIFVLPPRREIEATAKQFYDALVGREKTDDAKIKESSQKLSAVLLAPVADKIGAKRLAIVSDGILQFIPFAALTIVERDAKPRFLIEKNEIAALPSATVLTEIRRNQTENNRSQKTLTIYADAVFEPTDTRLPAETAKNSKPPENALVRKTRTDEIAGSFPRLLSSRVEARALSALLPKDQVDLNIDFEANRENVRTKNLRDFKIVHFATHGVLDTARPEFSGLVLSLFDQTGKPQDGFLRLNQIYNLELNSDLVVLSACQTALGKNVRGEGLIGLTRGFMYAGARRVVATLWKVDDAATAEFMKRFYRNLLQKNMKPSAALFAAQNEMKQIPRFRAPYFWAGFVLQGDWR